MTLSLLDCCVLYLIKQTSTWNSVKGVLSLSLYSLFLDVVTGLTKLKDVVSSSL